jgi:hypothetical protein
MSEEASGGGGSENIASQLAGTRQLGALTAKVKILKAGRTLATD